MPICGGNEKTNPAIEADLKKSREASKKDIKGMQMQFLLTNSLVVGRWRIWKEYNLQTAKNPQQRTRNDS